MRMLPALLVAIAIADAHAAPKPMRPLPRPSARAATGTARYVAPTGSDSADGSKQAPWKTIAHALAGVRPGDAIYLRGGVYHEPIVLTRGGTASAPLTIRSAPGELAIVDAGIAEFVDSPSKAWEPATTRDEYRSTATYPALANPTPGVRVTGNFADTMIPLHGYRWAEDLRATNVYFNIPNGDPGTGIYLGPGVWFDPATSKIHARLTPIGLRSLPDYDGPRDPRQLGLVISTPRNALKIENASYIRIQDVVLRGSSVATVYLDHVDTLELDGVTIYGGATGLHARSTSHFKLVNSTIRGEAAPWSSRPSMKYRGNSPYLLFLDSAAPQSVDWELAHDEFVDGHDGLVIDGVKKLRFHHNRIENLNDDGLYLTYVPRETVGDDIQIYENVFSRIFTVFAFGDTGTKTKNSIGQGVYVFRNVFDLRRQAQRALPKDAAEDAAPRTAGSEGRMCGDHGNPIWEPLFFYQNTVLAEGKPFRGYYGVLLIQNVTGSRRRIFNNVFLRTDGDPGLGFQRATDDLQVDNNLLWGVATGPTVQGDFFAKFRRSKQFLNSQAVYAPGWGAHDLYSDPRFKDLSTGDVRLGSGSPAIDAGMVLPTSWPDTLRARDSGKPDIGALPLGAGLLVVGPSSP